MIFRMKKFYRILPLVLVFAAAACNPKTYMNIEEVPLPPEARQSAIDGRYETQLDAATNAILSEMKKNYTKTAEKILFLPPDADAAKVFEFYTPKMSEKGLTKDANVPLQGRNFRQIVWKNDRQAISTAVIEAGTDADGRAIKFLAIHLGEK
jgi:hypothetical protein